MPSVPGSHNLLSVCDDAFILHIPCEVMSLHFTAGVSSISSRSIPELSVSLSYMTCEAMNVHVHVCVCMWLLTVGILA